MAIRSGVVAIFTSALLLPAAAHATTTCTYDPATRTLALVSASADGSVTLLREDLGAPGFLYYADDHGTCPGATVTNTDRIVVRVTDTDAADGGRFTLDQGNGRFQPG